MQQLKDETVRKMSRNAKWGMYEIFNEVVNSRIAIKQDINKEKNAVLP